MNVGTRRAVFLDRDGVLNRAEVKNGKPYPPANLAELQIMSGLRDVLDALKAAGFLLVGVTNQPDVARGTQRRDVVEAINAALLAALPLEEILVCYHDDGDGCDCRKPLPGLLLAAAARYDIDLSRSFVIGDRWRDVEAGRRAGCRTVLVDYQYAETVPDVTPDHSVGSVGEVGAWILEQENQAGGAE